MEIKYSDKQIAFILGLIHKAFAIEGGCWNCELIEQSLALKYISEDDHVLEIGSNIGRVSIVLGQILSSGNGRLLTLESNADIYKVLSDNIDNIDLPDNKIICLNKALSIEPVQQLEAGNGWQSYPANEINNSSIFKHFNSEVWHDIETITLDYLLREYSFKSFNALVIDCEGAFYFILRDFGDRIFDGVKTIIIENDCSESYQTEFILNCIRDNGFVCVENKTSPEAWGPYKDKFWQVYKHYQ